jgi:hypothetical protein
VKIQYILKGEASMESEIGRKILLIVAKRGYTGADREVFFHDIRGISYSDLEKEVLDLERDRYITVEWVGPSNFSVMITPKGVELVKTYGEDVWHKDVKALEDLDRARHAKKTVHTQKVDYTKMLGEKIHVAEVGNLPDEIIDSIDEHIIAERAGEEQIVDSGAIGVPAVEEQIVQEYLEDEKGIKIKRMSGELENDSSEDGETITIGSTKDILEDTREARIAVDKATKLEKRVKEKRISGDREGGTPISEPKKARGRKKKEYTDEEIIEEESSAEPLLEETLVEEEALAEEEVPPDFYKEIEEALDFDESLVEEILAAGDVGEEAIAGFAETICAWEPESECHMIRSGMFGDIDAPTINHCIMCQLLEIKKLIKK